tara:strand:+ start:2114 stop:4459 length:2346 start_codon:yes stop_codon:yes gene_type:complete
LENSTETNPDRVVTLKLAFCLYKYFPYGGLQLDFLNIAIACQRLGHTVRVYTLDWVGGVPDGFEVVIVPVEALTNHKRNELFSAWVKRALDNDPVDGVIGINKMPGLDVYFCGDSCYEEKMQTQRVWFDRQLPRYHHFACYEQSVFGTDSQTKILMISDTQRPFFEKHYGTPRDRMHFLPPGIAKDRIAPPNVIDLRNKMRAQLGVAADEYMLLTVGSGFKKKGVRRSLYALRSLPKDIREKTKYFIVGKDKASPFRRLIFWLGLRKNVTIFSFGRHPNEIPKFLFAADLLLHPATDENAGIILLEAVVAGLPVIATDNCGYGHYIEEAGIGCLIPNPFSQSVLNEKLLDMLFHGDRNKSLSKGREFAATANIYSLHSDAACQIENVVHLKARVKRDVNKFAFCLYKYMTFGGLQLDFMRIAMECQARGHSIRIYTLSWEGYMPPGFDVILVPASSMTNHSRNQKFSRWVKKHLQNNPVDCVIGFNKMPELDIYYAADYCYQEKMNTQRSWFDRQLPRYHHFSKYEKAVFDKSLKTKILMISEVQKPLFVKYYGTQESRFHLLPPGILKDRIAPADGENIRADLRKEFDLGDNDFLLLMIGSGFKTKGLDRILVGMAFLPPNVLARTRLIAIGQDMPNRFYRMAHRLNLGDAVKILKGREDIPRFLLGADLLVHPAYMENTGTVLLEAIVAGLPVLASDVCGYARYVEEAKAGNLIPSPFDIKKFASQLLSMITSEDLIKMKNNGLAFAENAEIYSMPERAADFICFHTKHIKMLRKNKKL